MKKYILWFIIFGITSFGAPSVFSQEDQMTSDEEIQDVESTLGEQPLSSQESQKAPAPTPPPISKDTLNFTALESTKLVEDMAVLQKIYMPKTRRFVLGLGGSLVPNDVFFHTMGLRLSGSYHLNEAWGLELSGNGLTSIRTDDNKALIDKLRLKVSTISAPRTIYSLSLFYNPFYGKASYRNRKIIPFETYFTLGFAQVTTADDQIQSGPRFGLGQFFSQTRSSCIRWDLEYFMYQVEGMDEQIENHNSLIFSISWAGLLPGVSKR